METITFKNGNYFLVEKNNHFGNFLLNGKETVTMKSNEGKDNWEKAETLPIVIFDNLYFPDVERLEDDCFNVHYCTFNRPTQKTLNAIAKWYIEKEIKFDKVTFNPMSEVFTVKNARF
jgi:hypothetical protein